MPNIRCKTCGRTYSYEKQCSGKIKLDTEGVEIGHGKDVRWTKEKHPWTTLLPL